MHVCRGRKYTGPMSRFKTHRKPLQWACPKSHSHDVVHNGFLSPLMDFLKGIARCFERLATKSRENSYYRSSLLNSLLSVGLWG
jgi:hypothetical protein